MRHARMALYPRALYFGASALALAVATPAGAQAMLAGPSAWAVVSARDIALLEPAAPRGTDGPADPAGVSATATDIGSPAPPPSTLAAGEAHAPGDPLERMNRRFFNTQSGIDRHFFRPIALFYQRVVPRPIRSALRNIIRNLTEPVVFANDMLQLRPGRALRTLSRFTINTTVGIGGVLDVAKTADLPHRNNGFGNTLGRYGVGPGPYLYLPLIGPTTVRDLLGGQVDGLTLPLSAGFPFGRLDYQLSRGVVSTLDTRAESDGELRALLDGAVDPYATLRSVYLQNRAAEIADILGKPIDLAPLDDPMVDPAATDPDADPNAAADTETAADPADADGPADDPATLPADAGAADPAEQAAPDPGLPPRGLVMMLS